MRLMVGTVLLVAACADSGLLGGAADIAGEDKADGGPGIEVTARIAPSTVDVTLSTAIPRRGYVFYAAEDAKVTIEASQATALKIYGPRLQNGTYPKTLAQADGKQPRISEFHAPFAGFYLLEVTFGGSVTPSDGYHAQFTMSCDGACDTPDPIVPIDEGLKWYRRSAERRALTSEVYAMATQKLNDKVAAGPGASWAVVLDVDETTLNNSAYQQARLDLGVGFSPGSWTDWVNQKAATPIDGVVDFTRTVKQLGGTVALVTNRKAAGECPQTETNLHAVGVSYDVILCQVDTSDKNPRFQALAAGTAAPGVPALHVIEYVGDNILDFPNESQDLRKQDASAFHVFGEDFFLIPNPMYGSFDKNTDVNPN